MNRAGKLGFEQAGDERRLGDTLWEIHAAGSKILEFTAGRSFVEFEESELLQAFAGKMLGLVGEGLRELRQEFPEEFAGIPEAERLAVFAPGGEVPATPERVWRVLEEDLPPVVAEVRAKLELWHGGDHPSDPKPEGRRHWTSDAEDPDEHRVEYEGSPSPNYDD